MSGAGTGRWGILPLQLDTVHYPDWHPRAGEYGPVYAYLLEDDEHLVLVDTGIGPAHELLDRLYEPERRDIVLALAQNNGIEPGDVDAIVLSHLHFDHVGGAQFFGDTPIYVQRAEWEAAQAPKYTIPEFLAFEGANFVMLDGETELAPGLRLVVTADHTPGHQVVAVSTPAGTIVMAGQSVETCAEYEAMLAGGELREGARTIVGLEPTKVFFSHDHRGWER
ncbi:MAG: N-acyl homoserine lactonase family protein [Dehalococcoidia bacterium]